MDNFIDLFAQFFGGDANDEPSGPTQQEASEAVQSKIRTARGLWHGDDADAQVARLTLNACEAYLMSVTEHGAISGMLHRTINGVMNESVKVVDTIARLGVVRSIAQGKPTPDDVEWLRRDAP